MGIASKRTGTASGSGIVCDRVKCLRSVEFFHLSVVNKKASMCQISTLGLKRSLVDQKVALRNRQLLDQWAALCRPRALHPEESRTSQKLQGADGNSYTGALR